MSDTKNQVPRNFDLSSFKRANKDMIAKNDCSWDNPYGYSRSVDRMKQYTLKEMDDIIDSNSLLAQQSMSREFFKKNTFYKQIILHYATLLKYRGLLIPNPAPGKKLSTPHIEKKYYLALDYIDKNFSADLFTSWAVKVLIDGACYGVIQKNDKKELIVMDLPTKYCRCRFKDIKGNDIVEFNVAYFDTIFSEEDRKMALMSYPKIISNYYNKKNKARNDRYQGWVKLPTDIGYCFYLTEDARPFLLGVIPATAQYDETVDIQRERDLEEIRKIIVQKIPHLADGTLLFEPDEAVEMHSGSVEMMKGNRNVSVLTSYAEVDSITSHTAADSKTNSLDKMSKNIFLEGGVSEEIFSPSGSQSVKTSIINDMSTMLILANKFSKFITYNVNFNFANNNIDFAYVIQPINQHNESDYITDTLKLAQSGYSFLLPALGGGLSQRQLTNIKELENDVLKLKDILLPLESSYTQSADGTDGTTGAPTKKLEEKSKKTIDNEKSIDKQGGSN